MSLESFRSPSLPGPHRSRRPSWPYVHCGLSGVTNSRSRKSAKLRLSWMRTSSSMVRGEVQIWGGGEVASCTVELVCEESKASIQRGKRRIVGANISKNCVTPHTPRLRLLFRCSTLAVLATLSNSHRWPRHFTSVGFTVRGHGFQRDVQMLRPPTRVLPGRALHRFRSAATFLSRDHLTAV